MRIDILTLFPEMFEGFINSSIIKRGIEKEKYEIHIHDFREFSQNKHKKVDDTIYGGGAGMLISVEPVVLCLKSIPGYDKACKILLEPVGKKYVQSDAIKYSKMEHLIIICGHYEGFDKRIENYIDDIVSIGDFVLTGGEVAGMAITDSVVRLLDGVISDDSIIDESFNNDLLEYDQYTKPQTFEGVSVPDVLQSGNHEEIRKWRLRNALEKTLKNRPDLLENKELTKEEKTILEELKK